MKHLLTIFFAIALTVGATMRSAQAQVIRYVTTTGAGANNGTSWGDAYNSTQVQIAINKAGITQVWIAKGTYKPTTEVDGSGDRFKTFQMKNGVAIYGGFAGTENAITQRTNYGSGQTNETIFSGDLNDNGLDDNDSYHVFNNPSGLDATAILDGFTIRGGNANGVDWPHYAGGGMYNISSSPALTNCTFTTNLADIKGGGVCNMSYSSPTLTNCMFTSNPASYGGGMYNYFYSSPAITNCTFTLNSASYGGGICNENSSPTLNNSIVWGNTASSQGNQFCIDRGTTTLNYSCYANGTNDVVVSSGTFTATNNNITSDPLFVGPSDNPVHPYSLLGISPCVDAGNDAYNSQEFDIRGAGYPRKLYKLSGATGTIDMGAYEYKVGADPPSLTRYVTQTGAGANNGTSWGNAYNSTQAQTAINEAGVTQVWIAKGTYKPTTEVDGSGDRFKTFQMKNGVAIYGGFAGTETAISQRMNFGRGQTNETILSGDLNDNGLDDNDSYHVFSNPSGLNTTALLDGFTIKGGNANGASPQNCGGGMYNYSSSPAITNCTFTTNSADLKGGGVCNMSLSSPALTNCTFTSNSTNGKGGGMYNYSSSPAITNCTLTANSADEGGGMCTELASPTLNNSIVWGNTAVSGGNQLYTTYDKGGKPTLNYSCYAEGTNDVSGPFIAPNTNITSDPLFVGPSVNPVHLYSISGASPCVDAGNDTYNSQEFDIRGAGYPRKLHKFNGAAGTIDMGAYEYKVGDDLPSQFIRYVTTTGAGAQNGTNWGNAYNSTQVQTAIIEAGITQVWIAKGTYKPTTQVGGTGERFKTFQMKNGVALYGGFAGTEKAIRQRSNYGSGQINETILSGDLNDNGLDDNDSYHVFYNPDGLNSTAVLDGFTIKGGNANATVVHDPFSSGGGMYNYNSSPAITNCTFISNWAYYGGGMIIMFSSPTLTNCIFTANSAYYYGGGMEIADYSSPTLTNCTFTANSAGRGGGMSGCYCVNVTLNNSIVWGNTASGGSQFYFETRGGGATLNYSCYANGTDDVYSDIGTFIATNNNITSDPLFVGASVNPAHPYALQGVSPCVDAGNDTYNSQEFDIRGAGYPRKLDKLNGTAGTIDMGAYEYNMSVPLPVELSFFNATTAGNNSTLTWKTATEVNNYGFEVERRKIQKSESRSQELEWKKVGFVNGAGTSNSPHEYSYTDGSVASGTYAYRLKQIDNGGMFKYSQETEVIIAAPKEFALGQNYPNPFNPTTVISYQLPVSSNVSLKIFDMLGREVATLVNEAKEAGSHRVMFDGSKLSSGIYFYRLDAGSFTAVKKLVLMK